MSDLTPVWRYDPMINPLSWSQGFADPDGLVVVGQNVLVQFDWATGKALWNVTSTKSKFVACAPSDMALVCKTDGEDMVNNIFEAFA